MLGERNATVHGTSHTDGPACAYLASGTATARRHSDDHQSEDGQSVTPLPTVRNPVRLPEPPLASTDPAFGDPAFHDIVDVVGASKVDDCVRPTDGIGLR